MPSASSLPLEDDEECDDPEEPPWLPLARTAPPADVVAPAPATGSLDSRDNTPREELRDGLADESADRSAEDDPKRWLMRVNTDDWDCSLRDGEGKRSRDGWRITIRRAADAERFMAPASMERRDGGRYVDDELASMLLSPSRGLAARPFPDEENVP